jgi:hypothetical protein
VPLRDSFADADLDEVAGYMRDIEINDDELDRVTGFGSEKAEPRAQQIEQKA